MLIWNFSIEKDINRFKFPSCSFSANEKLKKPVDFMKGYDTYLTNYCKNQNVDKVEKQVTMCLFN